MKREDAIRQKIKALKEAGVKVPNAEKLLEEARKAHQDAEDKKNRKRR